MIVNLVVVEKSKLSLSIPRGGSHQFFRNLCFIAAYRRLKGTLISLKCWLDCRSSGGWGSFHSYFLAIWAAWGNFHTHLLEIRA